MNAVIKLGDRLTLHYRLNCNGERVVDTFAGAPETFTLGHGEIDPRLEALLIGLEAGDHRTFELAPGAAFGAHDAGMVHNLARTDFAADMVLLPGHEVEFALPNGQTMSGVVQTADVEQVRVDFNHPLAGLAVEFEVEILAAEKDREQD